jgi:hypothetical protein
MRDLGKCRFSFYNANVRNTLLKQEDREDKILLVPLEACEFIVCCGSIIHKTERCNPCPPPPAVSLSL